MEIDFRNLPKGYVYCFNSECTRHEQCLRWIVSNQYVTDDLSCQAVRPHVARLKACPFYSKPEVQRMAWGFTKLFAEVKAKDGPVLREQMRNYLGGMGTYSRYKLGRRLLTPQQQKHIISLFRKKGYTEGLEFDNYVMVYDLDH